MNIAFFGECMIELRGEPLKQSFGGDTLNTAFYFSRLQQKLSGPASLNTYYVTAMGQENLSQKIMQSWQKEGINTELVLRFNDRLPGIYLVKTDNSGERSFKYWRNSSAARSYFSHASNSQDKGFSTPFEKAIENKVLDAIYLSGISLAILNKRDREHLVSLLQKHKDLGGAVYFDNNFRPALWNGESAREIYIEIMRLTDFAFLTEEDDHAVFGYASVDEILERYKNLSSAEIIIKRGKESCVACSDDEVISVPAQKVQNVVDTCAAGDAFAAAYLYARLNKEDIKSAAELGHALAAKVIQYEGAITPAII